MPKANLLYVVTKLELGGAQKNVLDLAAGIDREKFRIFLFTAREGLRVDEALAIRGISVRRSRFLDRPLNPFKDLLALIELCIFIRRKKIRIVHTHSSKAGILGRLAAAAGGAVAVHTVHGWSFNDRQPAWARVLCVCAERMLSPFTRAFIAVSECDIGRGLGHGIGPREKYSLIRYGIDAPEFARAPAGRTAAAPVIGTVACLKRQKSPGDFICCAAFVCREFPRARFALAGDGVLRRDTERLVREAGLEANIELCGWRRDIPEFLATLDVFCLTSLWEGLPIAVIEAMAAGLAVVCTDTGGISEVIRHGVNGFLVPPGDMRGMSRMIVRLLENGELRRKVGRRAAHLPEEFDTGFMLRRTQRLYETLSPRTERTGGISKEH